MFNPRFGRRQALALCAALLAGAASPALQAQDFPSKPIKFIVPFGPGSGTDTSARYYAKKLQQLSGSRCGGGEPARRNVLYCGQAGLVCSGRWLHRLYWQQLTLAVNTALFKELPYDPQKDFAPLTMMMRAPAIVVARGCRYQAAQGFGGQGPGQPGQDQLWRGLGRYQLMGELFNDVAKVQTVHVPFKGAGEVATAVAGHTVDYAFAEATSVQI
ncbi:Bug family tripartite tricarboxylate transporter substrate binding protein [Comamonas sp. JC664]|uniref:Bug family tripartite tricarboxylate transporter substrate binding protein n=1 Tax=Comamonas sp. JC664 TaxID=2801917 RepID=UPI003617943F